MASWTEQLKEAVHNGPAMKKFLSGPTKHFLLPWLEAVEVVDVEKLSDTTSRIIYRFPVQPEYFNLSDNLHGGAQAAFFDVATTYLLFPIRKPGFWMSMGTTRSLNCTYIRPAPQGEMLLMECEIVHAGKRLCALKAVLKTEKDGKVVSTCEHNKYNLDADAKV